MRASVVLYFTISLYFAFKNSVFYNNSCTELWAYPISFLGVKCHRNPDIGSTAPIIATRHKYPVETHYVTTSDGYILTIFRVLPKKNVTKSPIFIQHGAASNANHFISTGDRALAFNLADLGHDVWLGNFRGTTYSQNHVNLTTDDQEFWDYTWEDLMLDVRHPLKYVAEVTGKSGSIIYIGHSLGNALFYIYAIEHPEEAQKLVQGVISLAPAIYEGHSKTFTALAPTAIPFLNFMKSIGFNRMFRLNYVNNFLIGLSRICPFMGKWLLSILCGINDDFPDEDLLMVYSNLAPTGTSANMLIQLFQAALTDHFQKFDYGKSKNLEFYGSERPPVYNLANIKIPVFILCGENDHMIDKKDCQRTYDELGSSVKFISNVPKSGKDAKYAFGHLDFSHARTVKKYLYEELMFPIIQQNFI